MRKCYCDYTSEDERWETRLSVPSIIRRPPNLSLEATVAVLQYHSRSPNHGWLTKTVFLLQGGMEPRLPRYIRASDWTHTELTSALKVEIQDVGEAQFFGQELLEFPEGILHTFYTMVQRPPAGVAIDGASTQLFGELNLMAIVPRRHRHESSIDNFLHHLLLFLVTFTGANNVVLGTQRQQDFRMAGTSSFASPNINIRRDGRLILVGENKVRKALIRTEPQLVAEAISAYQVNNQQGTRVIYGLIMRGLYPHFYRISITPQLSRAVKNGGLLPNLRHTIIKRYIPQFNLQYNEDLYSGMLILERRRRILRALWTFLSLRIMG